MSLWLGWAAFAAAILLVRTAIPRSRESDLLRLDAYWILAWGWTGLHAFLSVFRLRYVMNAGAGFDVPTREAMTEAAISFQWSGAMAAGGLLLAAVCETLLAIVIRRWRSGLPGLKGWASGRWPGWVSHLLFFAGSAAGIGGLYFLGAAGCLLSAGGLAYADLKGERRRGSPRVRRA